MLVASSIMQANIQDEDIRREMQEYATQIFLQYEHVLLTRAPRRSHSPEYQGTRNESVRHAIESRDRYNQRYRGFR